jgi:hypothetical protein
VDDDINTLSLRGFVGRCKAETRVRVALIPAKSCGIQLACNIYYKAQCPGRRDKPEHFSFVVEEDTALVSVSATNNGNRMRPSSSRPQGTFAEMSNSTRRIPLCAITVESYTFLDRWRKASLRGRISANGCKSRSRD